MTATLPDVTERDAPPETATAGRGFDWGQPFV